MESDKHINHLGDKDKDNRKIITVVMVLVDPLFETELLM
jgi:hypothetical protein